MPHVLISQEVHIAADLLIVRMYVCMYVVLIVHEPLLHLPSLLACYHCSNYNNYDNYTLE